MNRVELKQLRAYHNATSGRGRAFHQQCCRACFQFPDLAATLERNWEFLAEQTGQIVHMAQSAHQAYHEGQSVASWRECKRPICADAVRIVEKFEGFSGQKRLSNA